MSAVPQQASLVRTSYEAYLRAGFALVPIRAGKGPTDPGWNDRENCWTTPEQIDDSVGVGLAHAYSQTMSLDVDSMEGAKLWLSERGVDLDALLTAPDSVLIESGNVGHAKLLFKLPFIMSSKKITVAKKAILEFRCASAQGKTVQDVLPSLAVHPTSNQHYQWRGGGHFSNLPMIPTELLNVWSDLIAKDAERNIPMGEKVLPANMNEVTAALYAIDPGCSRQEWIEVGMALASLDTNLFDLWNDWSQGSDKYPSPREALKQWVSFKPLQSGITIASLFHHAHNHGWKRPPPDVSSMFKPVEPDVKYEEVKAKARPAAKVPLLPIELFPELLVRRAEEVAHEVGCGTVVPLVAGLAAVSGALDKRTKLRITATWRVPATVWFMNIGDPSVKKSPGCRPMLRPLHAMEREDMPRYEAEMMVWLGLESRHAAQMKAYREWQASPESQLPNAVPPTVDPLPPQPEMLRLVVSDSTSQMMVQLASNRPRGFLLWMDELHTWLRRQNDNRSTEDRGCWIQAYESGPYTMDRRGGGSIRAENLAASLLGNCQPEVFREQLEKAATDGFMQRFLPIVLSDEDNDLWQQSLPPFLSCETEYENMLRRTYAMPEFEYELSPEAMEDFRKFSQWSIKLRDVEKSFGHKAVYQTALGKVEGVAGRMILLWHVIENPYCPFVSRETVRRALAAMQQFFIPMMRHAFLDVAAQRDVMSERIFNVVLQWSGERATVNMTELRHYANKVDKYWIQNNRNSDTLLRAIMDELSVYGYVWLHQDHPRYPVWAINPAMAQQFKAERDKMMEDRAHMIDSMYSNYLEQTLAQTRGPKRYKRQRNAQEPA